MSLIRAVARLLAVPEKRATFGLVRGLAASMELALASALLRCGVMHHLSAPKSLAELSTRLEVVEPEVLQHLLDLAVHRRVLRRRAGQYRARSALARGLVRDPDGPIASMLHEVTAYHADVFDRLPGRLQGEPPRAYLEQYGPLVAQSSRIMAPWIEGFTSHAIGGAVARSILEIGCGAGAYLATYAALQERHHGVGLDLDPAVAAAAQAFITQVGLDDRFAVRQGDVRHAKAWPEGPFDVVTAHQNVYYFNADERATLWQQCRHHLAETGKLVIVTPTSGGPMSNYFSLILLSTKGCHDLPSIDDLTRELAEAGFQTIRRERLIPGDAVWGIEAQ